LRQNSHDARTGIEIVIASVPPLPGHDPADLLNGSGSEFVRRWTLHILPKGYTKTRRFGGYSNRHRVRYLTACRELFWTAKPAPPNLSASPAAETPLEYRCPKCESLLTVSLLIRTSRTDRPGWSRVMSSSHRPTWYREAWYDDG
jgi:hypothetical protein